MYRILFEIIDYVHKNILLIINQLRIVLKIALYYFNPLLSCTTERTGTTI